jgi:cell wall assembly regulator SMI1
LLVCVVGCSSPGDADPGPAAAGTAPTSAELKGLLDRIAVWYDANAPKGTCRFAPPASAEALAAVEAKLGRALPDDVRALYRVANGSEGSGVIRGYSLLSLEQLQDESLFWETLADGAWSRGQGWLPLTENGGGDHDCRDAQGRVFSFSHEVGREGDGDPTLRRWLERFASELEADRWVYSEENGQIELRTS